VWAFAFAGAGYGLGTGYRSFDHGFRYVEYAIVVGIVALLAYLVYRWIAQAKVAPRADDSSR
jgi:membrane protein DedA with SNARE-associated domain